MSSSRDTSEVLLAWLKYYGTFNYNDSVISVVDGGVSPRAKGERRKKRSSIFIRDPNNGSEYVSVDKDFFKASGAGCDSSLTAYLPFTSLSSLRTFDPNS